MLLGCNYWSSHAGTRMWELWDEDVIRRDLEKLAGIGCEMLRVFPNWRHFQPIEICYTHSGQFRDIYMKGEPLPDTPCGRAGVDEEMIRRFRKFAEIAEENGLSLKVALVTGWMSGYFYTPPALDKLNPLTDPFAQKWQVRYVRCLVRELKDCRAIKEWELGNESNCMGQISNNHEAWVWTYLISSAIKLEDPTRPVASGMHGLMPSNDTLTRDWEKTWNIQTQGELCDSMTAHPYPHSPSKVAARVDAHNSIRTALQASVEMLFYGDIAGRPSCVEEIGTFSPSYVAEKEKAEFVRNTLYNSWAHGSTDFLWWCGFDHSHLKFPPYIWSAFERELGFFDPEFNPKPVAHEITDFRKFKESLPFAELPPFQRDAVCISTRAQSFDTSLTNAWSAFILAKQNHFDIRYAFETENLPDAPLYIVPGLSGDCGLYGTEFAQLLKKAEEGATLYISVNDGSLAPFERAFGVEVEGREMRTSPVRIKMNGQTFEVPSPFCLYLRNISAEILATEENGNPVYVRNRYGKGWVYLLTVPVEFTLGSHPGAFHKPSEPQWRDFYAPLAETVRNRRRITCSDPLVTFTEHPVNENLCWAVAINNNGQPSAAEYTLLNGWKLSEGQSGEIAPFTGKVLKLTR